jgi:hypothetical protein
MDPITTAIVAVLAAGVTGGASELGKKAIVDSYEALKSLLRTKFGAASHVVKAVEDLEGTPDSKGRQVTLQEEVGKAHADQDPDIRQAAQQLLDRLHSLPGGEQHVQQAIGNYIAQADRGSSASVHVNQPKEES